MLDVSTARMASNWTSAAGALEGILQHYGIPLPRHAVMGLSGHAWHATLARQEHVAALPSGVVDLDWQTMVERYARTGLRFERYGGECRPGDGQDDIREAAIEWAIAHLDAGRPLIGWDFHLHEFGVVHGYDRERKGFLVDDVLSEEVGPIAHWRDWPSAATGRIELFAPVETWEPDAGEAVFDALGTAVAMLEAGESSSTGNAQGSAALDAWADAFESDIEVDRAGNAYMLVVTQTARLDGADFLAEVAEAIPPLAEPLQRAERALRDEAKTLAPLLTLFPFPTGGHGNVQQPGLRESAAAALRRAAKQERKATAALKEALEMAQE